MNAASYHDFQRKVQVRTPRIVAELKSAINAMPEQELREWVYSVPRHAVRGLVRRGSGLKQLAQSVASLSFREWKSASEAWCNDRLGTHLRARASESGGALADTLVTARRILAHHAEYVARNPREEVPVLAAGVLGFFVGSGGLDGDGGIPDLDLLGGIGAHRSLLTHTVIAGVVAETLVLSLVDLAGRIHNHLPNDHDQLWDLLNQRDSRAVEALTRGLSVGLAYHFAVDATADAGGAYAFGKGVVPPAADDAFQAANALAEGLKGFSRRSVVQKPGAFES